MKSLPFTAEVQGSGQTDEQQTHTEHCDNHLLFCHWLEDQLCFGTSGTIEASLTPAAQGVSALCTDNCPHQDHSFFHKYLPNRYRNKELILAVVYVHVHQQHTLALVQTVVVKRAVTVLRWPLGRMRALFAVLKKRIIRTITLIILSVVLDKFSFHTVPNDKC